MSNDVAVRDERGWWLKGHPPTGTNPPLSRLAYAKRQAILQSTTVDEALEVIQKMRDVAMDDEHPHMTRAAQIYLSYALGKPDQLMDEADALKTIDVLNLNRAPDDLSAEAQAKRLEILTERMKALEKS